MHERERWGKEKMYIYHTYTFTQEINHTEGGVVLMNPDSKVSGGAQSAIVILAKPLSSHFHT